MSEAPSEEEIPRWFNEKGEPSKHTPFEDCDCMKDHPSAYHRESYHCAYRDNVNHPRYGKTFLDE